MDKNVGSVDIEELKRAREELNKEMGIESDPNMYSDYNPNRESEEESSSAEQTAEVAAEEPASEDSSSNAVSLEDFSVPTTESLVDEVESFESNMTSEEPVVQPQPVQEEPEPITDFSAYDSFSAFEVNDGAPTTVVSEPVPETPVVPETPAEFVDSDPADESIIVPEETNVSEDVESEDTFEIKTPSVEQLETQSAEPEATGGLNLDSFDISPDVSNDAVTIENVEETNEVADIEENDSFGVLPTENPIEDSELGEFSLDQEISVEPEETTQDITEEPVVSEGEENSFSSASETPAEEITNVNNLVEEPVSVQHESSAEELTNINLHNEEISSNNSAEPKQEEDSLQIVGSFRQLEELLGEDEEAQKLIKEMQEVTEEAEEQQEDLVEAEKKKKHKYASIEPYKFVDVISTESFKNSDKLSYILGKNEADEIVYGNLRDSYNIAVFGKENEDVNNMIHSILLSLILKNNVSEINFIMCDSKADSKFEVYNKSSYMYFNRIAKTNKEILDTLIELSKELEERYKIFAEIGVKSIEQYNIIAKNDKLKPMPYLLTVFNNYSKAIQLTNSDKINACLHNILKFGRIVGLYLIVVANTAITSEEINYNLPTRLSFKTDDVNRSLTTLGYAGAESLPSSDDVLYSSVLAESTMHLKVASLTKPEIELLIENIED